ncbi:cytidine deaminase [soil metagenome]
MQAPTVSPEDAKILTLARATMARTQADEGAAVRDLDGRTYAAAKVNLASLQLGALQVAIAMAVSSGARGLEAAAICSIHGSGATVDLDLVREFGGIDVPVFIADKTGVTQDVLTT